ncbi:MAG TPA: RNA 2',3'-cyclic phosphodiesterase [Ramlibacter sp.]|uniref:RNA 2',3'-cyclic phosphodiesterase n=1 Tax=Ramlibacter sp. TaxID=1917967 RepID=UPI002C7AC081|nr:RNA 2',3'-cyclic phosphodiesterase [Ramlibacter sp.]HVZ43136.1 RNA 2',3'-cyclic phosphodiesterase [Ramlibacter sp.]
MSSTVRLFIALWPTPGTLEALVRHQKSWQWSASARLTRGERMHLTLHFLGQVPTHRVEALRRALGVPFEPFDLSLDTPETWRGGLAVLCADAVPRELLALHGSLAARLARLSLPLEDRPLRVHATLARGAQRSRPPDAPDPVAWPAHDGYALVRSLPGGQGYETLQRFS